MKIYNTLTKKKEEFVPLEEGKVKMYVCGPTVYNFIHIGNARPMIVFDTVRRYFEYKNYDVNYVSNFTDVDDKIIKKANEEGVTAEEISQRYIAECKKDMDGMNIEPATKNPLATEEIGGMISMIETLIEKGYAYEKNGTVYYRTRKFKDYGKLSHKNLDDLQSGGRALLVSGEDEKEDSLDFVLWKPKKEGEPAWQSPWGEGPLGNLFCRNAFLNGFLNDLIIHIRKVGYIIYFITFMLQVTSDGIKHDHRSCISDVDQIVYGRAAYIHADFAFLKRHKFFFLFG